MLTVVSWFQVNPARAGMILKIPKGRSEDEGKPRASGDDPPVGDAVASPGV